jgi:ATP-binding protein involved in chromosome partitioning
MLKRCFSTSKGIPAAKSLMPAVNKIIVTTSCKGGVGKSTVAMNLAAALAKSGRRVGLFDADIYGPSIPIMSKTVQSALYSNEKGDFVPIETHGVHTVSVGHAVAGDRALIWKGPLVGVVVSELLGKAKWPNIDYLIVDTPPGTGDVLINLMQQFKVDGVVLVTTPQRISTVDVVRNFDQLKTLKVPIVGLIENLSGFTCGGCGSKVDIWPGRGGEEFSKKFSVPLLGKLKIDENISKCGDDGVPVVVNNPDSEFGKTMSEIAEKILSLVPVTKEK